MRKCLVLLAVCLYTARSNAQNIGVGVSNPQNKLHVGGGLRLDTLTSVGGAGLLKHDANGVVHGIKFSANANDVLRGDGTFGPYNPAINGALGWLLTGNSGTNATTNFLGTSDNVPLRFRTNNFSSGLIDPITGNTTLGYQSLLSNTTGHSNVAIGRAALKSNTEGWGMVAIGDSALYNQSRIESIFRVIYGNTAVGYRSSFSNTFGYLNTATGYEALYKNISGTQNTAIGSTALRSNTTGHYNIAVGSEALEDNTTGSYNVAIGGRSLQANTFGTENTAVGLQTLYANTSGYDNSAFGLNAMIGNTTGYFNTGIGARTLNSNTVGHDLTAIGYGSMANVHGSFNTAVGAFSMYTGNGNDNSAFGYKALETNGGSCCNIAIGYGAMQSNGIGSYNTVVGFQALSTNNTGQANTVYGYGALRLNKTGEHNVAVGNSAMWANSTGYNNTVVGSNAGGALPNNITNAICLGYGTGWVTTTNNHANIGNFSMSWIGGQVGWFHYSDRRIKNNIVDDVPGLAFITKLKPITYHVDIKKQEEIANAGVKLDSDLSKELQKDWEGKYDVEKIKMSGFFAQDVEEAANSIKYSFSGLHNPKNGGLYSLDYSAFVVPLVKAVQEQQKIIEDQNKKMDKQQQQIDLLIKEMQNLKKDLITQNK